MLERPGPTINPEVVASIAQQIPEGGVTFGLTPAEKAGVRNNVGILTAQQRLEAKLVKVTKVADTSEKSVGGTLVELGSRVLGSKKVRAGALVAISLTTMGAECGDGGLQQRQQERRLRDLQDGPPDYNEDRDERIRQRKAADEKRKLDRQRRREERSNN